MAKIIKDFITSPGNLCEPGGELEMIEQLEKELGETKVKLTQSQEKLETTVQELSNTKETLSTTSQELESKKGELSTALQNLDNTNEQLTLSQGEVATLKSDKKALEESILEKDGRIKELEDLLVEQEATGDRLRDFDGKEPNEIEEGEIDISTAGIDELRIYAENQEPPIGLGNITNPDTARNRIKEEMDKREGK